MMIKHFYTGIERFAGGLAFAVFALSTAVLGVVRGRVGEIHSAEDRHRFEHHPALSGQQAFSPRVDAAPR